MKLILLLLFFVSCTTTEPYVRPDSAEQLLHRQFPNSQIFKIPNRGSVEYSGYIVYDFQKIHYIYIDTDFMTVYQDSVILENSK